MIYMSRKIDSNASNAAIWKSLSAHIERGEEATRLLEKLFLELGPYRNGELCQETWDDILRFMEFDDSE